ncbi:FAD-binding protein [Streptomyces sp. NPDC006235]|uniref:FAD-binding protein n=1 Tax=Streptomyces sp. NPDC006235 TaxID=3156736 RepID=UPI0033A9FB84
MERREVHHRVPPRAVPLPRTADHVVAVLRSCREAGIPVTARGDGTPPTRCAGSA